MDLTKASFKEVTTTQPKADAKPAFERLLDPDIAETDSSKGEICSICRVEESKILPNGTCDTCGQGWQGLKVEIVEGEIVATEDDDDDDEVDEEWDQAINLLEACRSIFEEVLVKPQVMHKMSFQLEQGIRNLLLDIQTFMEFDES